MFLKMISAWQGLIYGCDSVFACRHGSIISEDGKKYKIDSTLDHFVTFNLF